MKRMRTLLLVLLLVVTLCPVKAEATSAPIAYINDDANTTYMSLQEAVDAAVDGDTIKMLGDFMLYEEDLAIDKITFGGPVVKNISFDLGGYKFDLKGGTIDGDFTFENGCLNVSDDACVIDGSLTAKNGVVNIKGGTINGLLNIANDVNCGIWAGSFPSLGNEDVKPYLVADTPFYPITVTARPSIQGANWPIEVPSMQWLTVVVPGGASVMTMDGCFIECRTGVTATFTPNDASFDGYECSIGSCGYSGLANGDNLVTVSTNDGSTTFTMCPADTYTGVLGGKGNVNVNYRLIPVARYGVAGTNGTRPDTANYGSLDDALTFANGLASDTAYIELLEDVDITAPLVFAEGTTTILNLNGYDIDRGLSEGTANGNVITVRGNLTLCDTSANAATAPGKITGGFYNMYGGGVYIPYTGTFTMNSGSISGNTASLGGGVNVDGGTFIMNGGTITENSASYNGGGVNVHPNGTFTMNGGSISSNSVTGLDFDRGGGGVCVWYDASFTMENGTISENFAPYHGGGVLTYDAFTMNGGSIFENSSTYDAGVYVSQDSTFVMTDGAIKNNTSSNGTGGVMVAIGGTFSMSGGVISGNKGPQTGGVFLCAGDVDAPGGILNMSGGSITGNVKTAVNNDYGAGGVSCVPYAAINLSGSATVSGNTEENDHPSNIWLKNDTGVNVVGALTGSLGVSKEYEAFDDLLVWRQVAQGSSGYMITKSDASKFSSDNGHKIVTEGNMLCLAKNTPAPSLPTYPPSIPSTPNVNVDINNGSLNDAAQAVGSAINNGSAEFKPAKGYTKADIATLQKNGKLEMTIQKKSGYNSADKNLIDAAIAKAGGAVSGTAVQYFDITVVLKHEDTGAVVATVSDTKKPISVTVDLGADLQKAAKDGKHIAVVRCHEGKITFLETQLNATKTKVTFSSSDFSTYAVVAVDKVISAQTFDAGIAVYVSMSVLAATGSAVVIGKKRKD